MSAGSIAINFVLLLLTAAVIVAFARVLCGQGARRTLARQDELRLAIEDQSRRLLAEKEQADQAVRLKTQFVANISREIRTPLTDILGTLDLVLSSHLASDQRAYLELCKNSAESILPLLDDALDFSRMDADRLELRHLPFSIRHCVDGVIATIAARSGKRSVRITADLAPDVPDQILADPERLRRVLLHVVAHAHFLLTHGTLTVRVSIDRDVPPQDLPGELWQMLRFEVELVSTVPFPDNAESVLQPFQSWSNAAQPHSVPNTFGHDVCGRLVLLMGGRVWGASSGSRNCSLCFTVQTEFPLAVSAPAPEPVPAEAAPRDPSAPVTILVVEDNRTNQVVTELMLRKRGFHVVVANNGIEALNILRSGGVDLVLMDIQMPVLGGIETTQRIRQSEHKTGDHIPIVALTANALPGDRQKYLRAGMDRYLSKPVNRKDLYQAIDELLAPLPGNSPHTLDLSALSPVQ